MEISPGWASTISAMNLAAGVAIATPCLTPFIVSRVGDVTD